MKKLFTLMASIVVSLTTTAFAVQTPPCGTQVLNADVSQAFTNGTVIALQCLDTNGGAGFYLNGAAAKSYYFRYSNLYRVVVDGNSFKLQSVEDESQYICRKNNLVIMGSKDANTPNGEGVVQTFTASVEAPDGWGTKPEEVVSGTNTIRFTASGGGFLNTNDINLTPKYFGGTGGYSVWYVYKFTDEEVNSLVEVTLTFTGINNETLTVQPAIVEGTNINDVIRNYCPEYFIPDEVTENNIISKSNNNLTISGAWDFPFTLDHVFRADLRKGGAVNGQQCTKWAVNSDGEISTRNNDNANQFAPENLFYFKGHGYDNFNRLIVSLHSIAYDDNLGFVVAQGNNQTGAIAENPTHFYVKTSDKSNPSDKGVSLQHSQYHLSHLNDISGKLGIYNADPAQNDIGSFIRFFDLTASDFATETYEHNGYNYELDETARATAQANPTSANVRAIFDFKLSVTVNTKYRGTILATTKFRGMAGDEISVTPPAFFTDEPFTCTISPDQRTVDYNVSQIALPFKYTETTDNMIWQAVQIHTSYTNNHRYTWTYSEADSNSIIEDQPANLATNGFADTQLWAFVGNMADGFKIYNKAAGTDMWLYEDGTTENSYVKVGTTAEGSVWKPYVSAANSEQSTYCCFRTAANHPYINLNVQHENATTLTHWGNADQGSTCWFTAAAAPMLANIPDVISNENLSDVITTMDVVGAKPFAIYKAYADAKAQIDADPYSYEGAVILREAIAADNATEAIALNTDKYYRLYAYAEAISGGYDTSKKSFITSEGDRLRSSVSLDDCRKNLCTLVKFIPVEDTDPQLYYIQSHGMYFGKNAHESSKVDVVADIEEAGTYELRASGHAFATYFIDDHASHANRSTERTLLFNGSGNDIHGWGPGVIASDWFISVAEDIEIELTHKHQLSGNVDNLGFAYLPYAVSAADETDNLHYVFLGLYDGASNDALNGQFVLSYTDAPTTVPANTGFMIRSSKNKVRLNIDYPAAGPANVAARIAGETTENILSGNIRTSEAQEGDFVLCDKNINASENDSFSTFFQKSTADDLTNNHLVYIPKDILPKTIVENGNVLVLNDPETTGIKEVNSLQNVGVDVVYDLQGRRLAAPVKGFNIINGRKVFLR